MKKFCLLAAAVAAALTAGCSSVDDQTAGSDSPTAMKIARMSANDATREEGGEFVLEILHVNDVHSYIDPTGVTLKTDRGRVRVKAGGPEAIKSVIEARRAQNPDLLVISAGDQITGNATNYDLFHGEADAALYGMLGTDFYVLGNHEFDHGGAGIATFIDFMKKKSPNTVLLNSDLTVGPDNAMKDTGVPEYFREVGGRSIAFYGVTAGGKIKASSSPDPDMNFADTVSTINAMTARNRDKAKIHVLVTHQGVIADRANSALLNDVDIIVGGDSHSLCGNFSRYGFKGECTYPMTRTNASGHKICVVQANEYGKIIGDLRVSFDADGNVLKCQGEPFMPLWPATASMKKAADPAASDSAAAQAAVYDMIADPESSFIQADANQAATDAMKPYRDLISRKFADLGQAPQDLCSTRYPTDECVIKNEQNPYGSETCRVFGMMYTDGTDADIFLANSGMFRVDVEQGVFTEASLLAVTPFSNELKMVSMKGRDFVKLLNQTMRFVRTDPAGRDGGTPCGSGFSYSLDLSASNPVHSVMISSPDGKTEAIEAGRTYRILTNDFLLRGKDGYAALRKLKASRSIGVDADVVRSYIRKHGSLPALADDSRTIVHYSE